MSEEARRIGHVISVSGAKLSGVLSPSGEAGANGSAADVGRVLQIGNLVKVSMPKSVAYGLVSKLEIRDPSGPPNGHDCRIIEIDLFAQLLHCSVDRRRRAINGKMQQLSEHFLFVRKPLALFGGVGHLGRRPRVLT